VLSGRSKACASIDAGNDIWLQIAEFQWVFKILAQGPAGAAGGPVCVGSIHFEPAGETSRVKSTRCRLPHRGDVFAMLDMIMEAIGTAIRTELDRR